MTERNYVTLDETWLRKDGYYTIKVGKGSSVVFTPTQIIDERWGVSMAEKQHERIKKNGAGPFVVKDFRRYFDQSEIGIVKVVFKNKNKETIEIPRVLLSKA